MAEHTAEVVIANVEKKGEGVWCTFCNKSRHTRDKCWKLHGKPASRDWGSQNRDKEWGKKETKLEREDKHT